MATSVPSAETETAPGSELRQKRLARSVGVSAAALLFWSFFGGGARFGWWFQ
jgi:hypothetical protein